MKKTLITIILLSLCSCSTFNKHSQIFDTVSSQKRDPASINSPEEGCNRIIKDFISADYNKNLLKALEDKELVKRSSKKMQIKLPKDGWWTRLKDSWTHTFKNWNDNKFVSLYMFDEDETVASAAVYNKILKKTFDGSELSEDEQIVLKNVDKWTSDFTNYKQQLDNLINERISIAYNLDILKRYSFEGERAEVELSFVKDGKEVMEKMVFYRSDKNLQYYMKQLDKRITQLDGGIFDWWFDEGIIKQRIIQQAMLKDKVTIVHRELEYFIQNTESLDVEVRRQLESKLSELTAMLEEFDFKPSQYGINKVTNKALKKELWSLPKTVKGYKKLQDGKKVMNELLSDQDKDRLKFFTNGHARVFQGTALGALLSGSGASIWIGVKEYFVWDENKKYECVKMKKEEEFLNCIQEYIEKKYPIIFQAAILSGDFNPFDYDNIPEDEKDKYKEELEHIKRLRVTFNILEQRKKKTKEDLRNSIRLMYDSIVIDEAELHSCARVTVELFPGCMIDYLRGKFPGVFDMWDTSSSEMKTEGINIFDFDSIPQKYKKDYEKEVKSITSQRATYEDFHSNFAKEAVFLLE
ncbi:hypothetical protein [Halobacteriovorax sp. HLS]|uniref:hypothetical protein n=1 Tax=Halobacteriovorax sp. HLS TaxID=2234000 RepID=UPI000FD78E94|nr:hypothetical protein [Halobacteriovorax sp. HLS]